MPIELIFARQERPAGTSTLDAVRALTERAEGAAETAAADAIEAAQPAIADAAAQAAADAAAAVAPAAADAIRAQVAADAERAEAAAEAAAAEVADEEYARRTLIVPEMEATGYVTEFVAQSQSDPTLRRLMGGFRQSDGILEVAGLIVRQLGGAIRNSRWIGGIFPDAPGSPPMLAFDYRGRVRLMPDERTIEYIADAIPGIGEANNYPMLPMSGGEFHKPMDAIIGVHAYGQSWEAFNGQQALAENDVAGFTLDGPRFSKSAITLADGKGFIGWGGAAPASYIPATDYIAGEEVPATIQTPTGAMAFRMASDALALGSPMVVSARSEARSGASLETIMPVGMAGATGDGGAFHAWEQSVIAAHAIAASKGAKYEVRFIPWTHGAANSVDSYSVYMSKLTLLLDYMQIRAMEITGQETRPEFLVVQHPSGGQRGYSENFKAIVDFCQRPDATLVTAGYGYDKHDNIHWNRWSAVEIGELRAIAARKRLIGLPWDSPTLTNPKREGAVVTFDVAGAHDVIVDESIPTDSHQVGGTYDPATGIYSGGTPVEFYGFEASLNAVHVPIQSVLVERRRVAVTLETPPASGELQIRYAMHNTHVDLSPRPDGRSVNRGTIRADWQVPSVLRPSRTLRRWLASDYFNFTI